MSTIFLVAHAEEIGYILILKLLQLKKKGYKVISIAIIFYSNLNCINWYCILVYNFNIILP